MAKRDETRFEATNPNAPNRMNSALAMGVMAERARICTVDGQARRDRFEATDPNVSNPMNSALAMGVMICVAGFIALLPSHLD